MAAIHNSLNALFSNRLSRTDEDNLSSLIEDYFCFDSDDENESDTDGKCIHITTQPMNLISTAMNFEF